MAEPLVSVVVCTHNGSPMLGSALQSLADQTLSPELFEVIVVDNASTDGSAAVAQGFADSHPLHRIVVAHETKLGLRHARNTGLELARGSYVAYVDDDARADRRWLEVVLACFRSVSPSPACVGGPILPFYTSPRPRWFEDRYEIRTWGDHPGFLAGGTFSGSNMAFRRDLLLMLGGFATDPGLGMAGQEMFMGEESELFRRIRAAAGENGRQLYYSPEAVVYHWVPAHKMTVRHRLARMLANGNYFYLFTHRHPSLKDLLRPYWWLAKVLPQILWLTLRHWREFPHFETWLVECGGRLCYVVGSLGFRPRSMKR